MTPKKIVPTAQTTRLAGVSGSSSDFPRGLGSGTHQVVLGGLLTAPMLARHPNTQTQLTTSNIKPNTNTTTTTPKITNPQQQQSTTQEKKTQTKKYPLIGIRLTPQELHTLQTDARTTGHTAQKLLKDAYFGRPVRALLVSKPELVSLHLAYRAIANTLNAVDEMMNAGVREGFHPEFDHVKRIVSDLHSTLLRNHGLH